MVSGVAAVAGYVSVLAFQYVPGLLVIESLQIPLKKWKVFPVVLGMAMHASPALPGLEIVGSMQAFSAGDS